jgi:hypothetical protein
MTANNRAVNAIPDEIYRWRSIADDLAATLSVHMPAHHIDLAQIKYEEAKATRQ